MKAIKEKIAITEEERKENLNEFVKKVLLAHNIRIDYTIERMKKDQTHGVTIDGYTRDGKVWAYVTNSLYMQITQTDDAIRYIIRFGKKVSEPLLSVDIDFEELDKKRKTMHPYFTIYGKEESIKVGILLYGGAKSELDNFFSKELDMHKDELLDEYNNMLAHLIPSVETSIVAYKSSEKIYDKS